MRLTTSLRSRSSLSVKGESIFIEGERMGHPAVISALKKRAKVAVNALPHDEFLSSLSRESDRGIVILAATMIDDYLEAKMRDIFSHLQPRELNEIFKYEGIAGTFSSRIKLAQALKIIDDPTRKTIELIREMRNACAHSRAAISFDTIEIVEAMKLMVPESMEADFVTRDARFYRDLFCLICGTLCDEILQEESEPTRFDGMLLMARHVNASQKSL